MKLYRVKSIKRCLLTVAIAFFSPVFAQEGKISGSDEYFVGYTPLSPSVWNSYSDETENQSQLRDYLFREAYLVEANNSYLGKEGKMFNIPTDDLTTTQRRLLSPYQREEEEQSRRDYAESVTSVVVNKGVPEYMLQLLGLQKLREGVKKVEKAVAVDITIGKAPENQRRWQPLKFRTAFLPFQRSYKMGFTNGTWTWDVQGGYTSSKRDYLFTVLSARWGKFVQSNTYQIFTQTGSTSLSYFFQSNLSLTGSIQKEFKDDVNTPNTMVESVGVSYIF